MKTVLVDELPSGRYTDSYIAEKLMGDTRARQYRVWAHSTLADYESCYDDFPHYTTNPADAAKLVFRHALVVPRGASPITICRIAVRTVLGKDSLVVGGTR